MSWWGPIACPIERKVNEMELQVLDPTDPIWSDLSTMKTLTCVNHPTAEYTTKNPWRRTLHLMKCPGGMDVECSCPFGDLRLVTRVSE